MEDMEDLCIGSLPQEQGQTETPRGAEKLQDGQVDS